jgi:hypothetical protein
VDLELTAQQRAVGTMDLPVDTVTGAVLTIRLPGRHKMSVFQERRRRVLLIAIGIGVDLKLVGSWHRRGQQQFVGRLTAAHRHRGRYLGIRIDRAGQTGPDFNESVAGLRCISDVVTVDRDRVEIPDLARQRDLADLVRQ